MKSDDQTLEVEITLAPSKGRNGGQRCNQAVLKVPDAPRVPRITRLMALAIKFQDMVDRGAVQDYADLARLGYVSRARLTQLMNLLLLAPDIQEELLVMNGQSIPRFTIAERHLRPIVGIVLWRDQKHEWARTESPVTSMR